MASALTACAPADPAALTLRLWDPQVATAYESSLAEFERKTGVPVDVVVVPWASYWTQLRADVGAGTADDLFWVNATAFADYAESSSILPVSSEQRLEQSEAWPDAAIEQFSADGELWGVPQITDPGIGLLYNTDLLASAGLTPHDVSDLSWDPRGSDDSLRRVARALTFDDEGRHPGDPGFDADHVAQYGYGSSNDLNAVVLQYLAGNGSSWQEGDAFTFGDERGVEAIDYVANLALEEHVAPPADETNPPAGGDVVRDAFLSGDVALFPTGAYNLANVAEGASFSWGIAPLPAGPQGAFSVTNSVVLAMSASSDMPKEQQRLARWLGSAEGQSAIGTSGSAMPATSGAQGAYLDYWESRGVDISAMIDILGNGTVQGPQGADYPAASDALTPLLNEVFAGNRTAREGIVAAENAANAAMSR
jgi:multiple sugar transport system substrate-binding protein